MPLTAATLLRVFIPFALGYFLSYVFRTVNAVIAPDLVAEIGLVPASLGLLTSAYFLTFAAFQRTTQEHHAAPSYIMVEAAVEA